MINWASHEFILNQTDDKGISQREHLEQVEKQTGRKPKDLENPNEFPTVLSHVWSFFIQLHNSRTSGFSGPNLITYQEIESWKNLTGNSVTPYEIDCIKRLDMEYMKVANG